MNILGKNFGRNRKTFHHSLRRHDLSYATKQPTQTQTLSHTQLFAATRSTRVSRHSHLNQTIHVTQTVPINIIDTVILVVVMHSSVSQVFLKKIQTGGRRSAVGPGGELVDVLRHPAETLAVTLTF